MNRAGITFTFLIFGWLIVAVSSVPALGQSDGETSVPEPTRLHSVALADGSKLVWSELVGEIGSSDAHATVSVVEVESAKGEQVRGMKIMLENSASTDQIYLTDSLLSNFQEELGFLDFSRQFDDECQAKHLCMHGIARCRPSQTERQAYCPGRYATPNSEEGLSLSTPRHSFKFPSVGTEQLSALTSDAKLALE
jgi:hypothetical protein